MQLVAYGAQDIYLTGNPQITFFKVVYRRHTNFSLESIEQTIDGSVGFGSNVSSTISRNGDLVHKLYVQFNPSQIVGTRTGSLGSNIGHTLLREMEVEIGGQQIDKHYSHWLTTWNNLTEVNPSGNFDTLTGADGDVPDEAGSTLYNKLSFNYTSGEAAVATSEDFAMVPLQFWFCRNPGLALPLIALQYHEVKIKLSICNTLDIGGAVDVSDPNHNPSFSSFSLWADYIYLDTDERRRFAQVSHEYLIEQLQFDQTTSGTGSKELNFNHPVKELIWGGSPTAQSENGGHGPGTLQLHGGDATSSYSLKFNGHDRMAVRHHKYFSRSQVYDYHSGFGGIQIRDSICVYSFSLKPEEHQPSGTCNFSRIDNAQLIVENSSSVDNGLNIYAVNYNVLRIMSGMGGLAYSN